MTVTVSKDKVWTRYVAENANTAFVKSQVGKWEAAFNDRFEAGVMCKEAVETGLVAEARHRSALRGTIAFYLNSTDIERHKKVLAYFKDHGLLRRTKNGNYADLPFKLIYPADVNEFGNQAKADILLSQFMNLETGEFLA